MKTCRDLALAAMALLAAVHGPAIGEEKKPAISLLLSRASAQKLDEGVLFTCQVVLDNATGRELAVQSSFHSPFDGLELVITNAEGKILAQPGYTDHQSPSTPNGRKFTLKPGKTRRDLVFPVLGLPPEVKTFKVRLVGTLPGSEYGYILSSETHEISMK